MEKTFSNFIQEITKIRLELGLSRQQLAILLGVHRHTIYRWEKGKTIPHEDLYELLEKYREIKKRREEINSFKNLK